MNERITVGTLQKPFGLKGEIRAKSMTSFPELRFQKGRHFFLKNPKTKEEREVVYQYEDGLKAFIEEVNQDPVDASIKIVGDKIEVKPEEQENTETTEEASVEE